MALTRAVALVSSRCIAGGLGCDAAAALRRRLTRGCVEVGGATVVEWGPLCRATRGVARVRINRYMGLKAVKLGPPKTEWQMAAEKEFLAMRANVPTDGYINGLTEDDVKNLTPEMQRALSLKAASGDQISRWRKQELIRKFQRRPFDTNSPAVRIAVYTEKILRMRTYLLLNGKPNEELQRVMSMTLSKRAKAMKSLYKSDFVLYRHVCSELGIRCVLFAIPDSRDASKMISPLTVDGDRAKFLIRQRMFKRHNRPREMRLPETGKIIKYTRHPMEPVPESHGKPMPVPQQVSRAWPYAVRQDRVDGTQVVYNPTAPGVGFWSPRGKNIGGSTSR